MSLSIKPQRGVINDDGSVDLSISISGTIHDGEQSVTLQEMQTVHLTPVKAEPFPSRARDSFILDPRRTKQL